MNCVIYDWWGKYRVIQKKKPFHKREEKNARNNDEDLAGRWILAEGLIPNLDFT